MPPDSSELPKSTEKTMTQVDETLSLDKVRHVARLSRLALHDTELEAMRSQLDSILHYVACLDAVDTSDVSPTFHAVPLGAPMREDAVKPGLRRSEVLRAAPAASPSGGVSVPKVLDVGGES